MWVLAKYDVDFAKYYVGVLPCIMQVLAKNYVRLLLGIT